MKFKTCFLCGQWWEKIDVIPKTSPFFFLLELSFQIYLYLLFNIRNATHQLWGSEDNYCISLTLRWIFSFFFLHFNISEIEMCLKIEGIFKMILIRVCSFFLFKNIFIHLLIYSFVMSYPPPQCRFLRTNTCFLLYLQCLEWFLV